MAHQKRWLIALVLGLAIAGGTAAVLTLRGTVSAEAVRIWVASLGVWAPVGFIVIYTLGTVALVPGGIFDLAGGALFGPLLGSVLDVIGGTLGSAVAFLVARYLARDWVEIRAGPRLQRIMRSIDEDGWQFVAFLRLIPILPFNIINYLLGLTRIPFHHYVLATMVFIVPSTVVYTWIGHAGRLAIAGDTDNLFYALSALGLLAAMIFLPRFYKRLRQK